MTDYLETAIRGWTEPVEVKPRRKKPIAKDWRPRFALVIDCETTIDAAQALTFGSYRYFRVTWAEEGPMLVCAEEGLFYTDDLPECDPKGFEDLRRYVETHRAQVDRQFPDRLNLLSRREFAQVLYQESYKKRSLVVGFNLPFDLSRLAVNWAVARRRFAGGHSMVLWEYEKDGRIKENKYRPRLASKTIDSKRALMGFVSPMEAATSEPPPGGGQEHPVFRGHFLDLRTLAFALTDSSHSLDSACRAFGVKNSKVTAERHGEITEGYISYNRRDVLATSELYVALMQEYVRHPLDLQPTKAYSPASIGKSYLRTMGIVPEQEREQQVPAEVKGWAMSAYFGGRAEARIRKVAVPVVYTDFLSMYPTVNVLMGLWPFHTAERIEVVDRTEQVLRLLENVDLAHCFASSFWRELSVLVEVEPQDDILPVRARYDDARDSWQIGVNPLTSESRWYALADVVASKLLTGKTPKALRAIGLVPSGTSGSLQQIGLRGSVPVDPATDDPFRLVVEERQRLLSRDLPDEERQRIRQFLKIFANATAYGIFAEMNRREGAREELLVYAAGGVMTVRSDAPEIPGDFCFPPIPAWIAAGARLMLAMLEASVAEHGGTYAMCDTDSMAIVATRTGGLVPCPGGPHRTPAGEEAIRAVTWDQVEGIRDQFEALNPYDREVVPGSILKLEKENLDGSGARRQLWCYCISAKRYAMFPA